MVHPGVSARGRSIVRATWPPCATLRNDGAVVQSDAVCNVTAAPVAAATSTGKTGRIRDLFALSGFLPPIAGAVVSEPGSIIYKTACFSA